MQKYIEHIQEIAKDDPAYTTPVPMDMKIMDLFHAFNVELKYIVYKFVKDPQLDVGKEIECLKKQYIFNYVIRHGFNWAGMDSLDTIRRKCNKDNLPTLDDFVCLLQELTDMQDYAFYDGKPCKEVIEDIMAL